MYEDKPNLSRKEFLRFKIDKPPEYKQLNDAKLEEHLLNDSKITLRSYQQFVNNLINPHTPYLRLFLKYMTGAGKTFGALFIALKFIQNYKIHYKMNKEAPTIFIIGFTKSVFQRELLTHEEFGFVSKEDIAEYKILERSAQAGGEDERKLLVEYAARLKKRLSKKSRGGFFKFMGFKAFFNRLFVDDVDDLTEVQIHEGVADGSIKLNQELVDSFANSLIICDELHNAYNSVYKNNYGIALQTILDIYEEREDNLRFVGLSATPINNSPSEVVDFLNLIIPLNCLPGKKHITKKEFFSGNELKPGSLKKIAQLTKGYISFLRDINPKLFPKRIIHGENIKGIDYLKFVRCYMHKDHLKAYMKFGHTSIAVDEQALLDMVFPNPGIIPETKGYPLFRTNEIKYSLQSASSTWKSKNMINYGKEITGGILKKENIKKWSPKNYQLITDILQMLQKGSGKGLIYNPYVHNTGILLTKNILLENGFIDDGMNPRGDTLCVKCGYPQSSHKCNNYMPARFIVLYSEIDKLSRNILVDKFNDSMNINGDYFKLVLGSKVIQESEDFKAIQHMYITGVPVNISTLIQIFGRGIRQKSHFGLPPENQVVNIRLYVSSIGKELSYEERKYKNKIEDYKIIQKIEKLFNENAVDAQINRNIIMPSGQEKDLAKQPPDLGTLYFKLPAKSPQKMITSTFNAFYQDEEVDMIIYIIKRLFLGQSAVWTYNDLWKMVQSPPFHTEVNPKLVDEHNFVIALNSIVWEEKGYFDLYLETPKLIDQLYTKHTTIVDEDNEYKIVQLGKYYVKVPISGSAPDIDVDTWNRKQEEVKPFEWDITQMLEKTSASYDKIKELFVKKFADYPINKLYVVISEYSNLFHTQLLEDIIEYMFGILVGEGKLSENHEFYTKMMYFYDKINMVLFADHILENEKLVGVFSKYILPPEEREGYNKFLMSSISRSSGDYGELHLTEFNKFVKKKTKKVPANMLPIGHFLNGNKLYVDGKWILSREPISIYSGKGVENDLIIGYYEK